MEDLRTKSRLKRWTPKRRINGVEIRLRGHWGWLKTRYIKDLYEQSPIREGRSFVQWLQHTGKLDSAVNGINPRRAAGL